MKPTLILFILLFTLAGNAQTSPLKLSYAGNFPAPPLRSDASANDSLPAVEYLSTPKTEGQTAHYLNGKLSDRTIIRTLPPQQIDSIRVEKKKMEINGEPYDAQIFITTKNGYTPRFISLTDLKKKYTKPTGNPDIFLIDNDVINDDYDHYLVDEKYILKIIVTTRESENGKPAIDVVRLLTRTEKNIKKSKEIMIRGGSEEILNDNFDAVRSSEKHRSGN